MLIYQGVCHAENILWGNIVHTLNPEWQVVVGMGWPSSRAIRRAAFLDGQTPRENYGHAVTLVGYRSTDRRLEDVTVYIQKYMGVNWGTDGYGYVRHNYMLKHLYGALVMESGRSLKLGLPQLSKLVQARIVDTRLIAPIIVRY